MRESQLEKNEFDNDSGEFATKKIQLEMGI